MKKFVAAAFTFVIASVAVIIFATMTCKVPAGYVAVQYSMNGGIKDEVLTQGWHMVSPTTKTSLYTVGLEGIRFRRNDYQH